jgi:cytochrome o ubiquinol oxidase subunit 1
MVVATMAICIISFIVWLHHFFTMGAGGDVNGFFGIATMIIAVPTGVKIFNWLFTMYGGRVRFTTPMMWSVAFMLTFIIGGMTGVLLAVPPADFVLHNSLFLIAHFHNVIIPGVLFAAFAGYTYWFPKAFGFTLDEGWGKAAFWFWVVGFYLAFIPLYVLGMEGMPRRLQSYDVSQWHVWTLIALVGAVSIFIGIACQAIQLYVSIRTRDQRRDLHGDPWDGRSLEWVTASPPPEYNFAVLPDVTGEEPYWGLKQAAREQQRVVRPVPRYEDLHMPRNSPTGFVCAFFAVAMGFSLIWHIWWLFALGFVGAYATLVVFAWRDVHERVIPAAEVARLDGENRAARNLALQEGRA